MSGKTIAKKILQAHSISERMKVINVKTGKKLKSKKIHPILLNLLKNGGLEKQLLDELKAECKEKN